MFLTTAKAMLWHIGIVVLSNSSLLDFGLQNKTHVGFPRGKNKRTDKKRPHLSMSNQQEAWWYTGLPNSLGVCSPAINTAYVYQL